MNPIHWKDVDDYSGKKTSEIEHMMKRSFILKTDLLTLSEALVSFETFQVH